MKASLVSWLVPEHGGVLVVHDERGAVIPKHCYLTEHAPGMQTSPSQTKER